MSDSELWSVALAADNIQTMTLDQLDDAFQRGVITESTLVWNEGMENWLKLGEVLGGEEEPPTAQAVAPQAVAQQPAPVAVVSAFPPAAVSPSAAVQQSAYPQARAAVPAAAVQGSMAPRAANSFPPAGSMAPAAALSSAPFSTAPVALSLGSDDLDLSDGFAGKKKAKWGYFAAAAVLLAGVGVTAANLSSSVAGADPLSAAAAARPMTEGDKPLPVSKQPDAPLKAGGYQVSASEEKRFKAEAEKEAELKDKMAAALANKPPEPKAAPARQRSGGNRQRGEASDGLKKSGAKYDPLNGSLP